MKLVITYEAGDGYTYWCTDTICLDYKSEEDFLVDFEAWAIEHKDKTMMLRNEGFLGRGLFPSMFFNIPDTNFQVRTLDKWFEDNL